MTTKVPVELSSTPGIADSSNATAVTITSDEDFLVRQTSSDVFDTNSGSTVRQFWGNQFSASNNTNSKVMIGSASNKGLVGGATVNASSKAIVNSYMAFESIDQTAGGEDGIIAFYTSSSGAVGTEKMRIQSGGNVLLNQTATADSGVADARLEITRSSQHCINCHVAGTGSSTLIAFINDNGFVGGINTNGSATVYNTSSDARLKNVLGEAKGLEIVNALNPVNFEWKSDGKIQDGLIAQEVEKVFPEAVSEPELEGEWYSVDYSKLVTPLIKGMQEQQTIIEDLKARIETLEE